MDQKRRPGSTQGIYFPVPADESNRVRATLADIASQLGYYADGGARRGTAGSIGKLLMAIAAREVHLTQVATGAVWHGDDEAPPVYDATDALSLS